MRAQVSCLPLFAAALLACEDPTLVCGGGRMLVDGMCLHDFVDEKAPLAVANPPGGRYPSPVTVEIHGGEEATIYFHLGEGEVTTDSPSAPSPLVIAGVDGELRFFAVDAADNHQVFVNSESYVIDTVGPTVNEIQAHPPDGTGAVLVQWSVPSADDFEGVLVVRDQRDPPTWTPSRGVRYREGDDVAAGVSVLHAGDSASELDQLPASGGSYYHAWGYDDFANYAETPASTAADGVLDVNHATLHVSLQNRTVTLAEPAVDFVISPSGNFHADGETVTLRLSVANNVGRAVSNLKLYVESLSSGRAVADVDVLGEALMHLGPQLIDPFESRIGQVTILDAQPVPDPVEVRLRIRADPTYVLPSEKTAGIAVDAGEPSFFQRIDCAVVGNPDSFGFAGGCAFEGWAWSPDYALGYAGSRNTPWLAVIDTSTWAATVGVTLGSFGHLPDIAISPDGQHLYVAHVGGTHRRGNNNMSTRTIDIVVLDRESLVEVQRIPLETDVPIGTELRAGSIALTPDGQHLAAVFRSRPSLFLVDLNDFSLTTVALPVSPLEVAIAPDGQSAWVGAYAETEMVRVDLTTLAVSTIGMPSDRIGAIALNADYVFAGAKGIFPGLHVYDRVTGETFTEYAGERITAMRLVGDGRTLAAVSRDFFRVNHLDVATLLPGVPTTLSNTARGHDLAATP